MRRKTLACLSLAFALALPLPVAAETDWSAHIGANGLSATAAALEALEAPAPADRFALGGVRFLGAIERALQARWRVAMGADDVLELPVLRLPIPPNPAPEPFTVASVPDLFAGLIDDLATSRAALDALEGEDFALRVRLGDLWFDINGNGRRDRGEGVMEVAGLVLETGWPAEDVVVRFDTADAAWLTAYTHFLTGVAQIVLAFDPEPAIARVMAAQPQFRALQADAEATNAIEPMFGATIDRAAMVWFALQHQPDPGLTRAARQSLLAMVAENRRFWALVALEDDDDAEWIPNDRQTAALGFTLPPGTGARWLAVLADAEAMLEGRKLIPHWRYGGGAGINLRRLMDEPAPIDIVAWAHGEGLLPWAERGERVTPDAWFEFERMMRGDAVLFALLLN